MISCVRTDGGVWYFCEAKLPEGWPPLTPVGEVQVKQYPAYRQAIVIDDEGQGSQNAMFRDLFNHIKTNDIAMTAPVDMGYRDDGDQPTMRSMSFLYDVPERGPVGEQGAVTVHDVPAMQVASIGVRGRYNDKQFVKAHQRLRFWLDGQTTYRAAGPPRFLGYNSPFVPFFWRYGEVQVPVEAIEGK